MLRAVQVLLVVSLAPAAHAQGAGEAAVPCPATAPAELTPFDVAKIADLVGVWDVVMMDTTGLRGDVLKHNGRLTLWLQDTPPSRPGLPTRPLPAGQKLLAAAWDATGADTGAFWNRLAERDHRAPGGVWAIDFLRMGEFGSGSGMSLYFRSMGPSELRGMWTSGSGMGITVDFTGDRPRENAGYYCARRVP